MNKRSLYGALCAFLIVVPAAQGALPVAEPTVRYMSLGDSLAAGYKAQPATAGFAFQLYLDEIFGRSSETVFSNAAVPGARSIDVLNFQVPQVVLFAPNVVTLSVGGNDLLVLLALPDPISAAPAVLGAFAQNLGGILQNLCAALPAGGEVYLNNLYTIPEIPGTDLVVPLFNQTMNGVVAQLSATSGCAGKTIRIADVYGAFLNQDGLLLIERYQKRGIEYVEVHPTNKGHRVMQDAYRTVSGR